MCKHGGAEEVCRLGSGGSFALHAVWMGTMKAFAGGGGRVWSSTSQVEQFCPQLDKGQSMSGDTVTTWVGRGR